MRSLVVSFSFIFTRELFNPRLAVNTTGIERVKRVTFEPQASSQLEVDPSAGSTCGRYGAHDDDVLLKSDQPISIDTSSQASRAVH